MFDHWSGWLSMAVVMGFGLSFVNMQIDPNQIAQAVAEANERSRMEQQMMQQLHHGLVLPGIRR